MNLTLKEWFDMKKMKKLFIYRLCVFLSVCFLTTSSWANENSVSLEKWFSKDFDGIELRGLQSLQNAHVLGAWGNKTSPYFFVIVKLSETNVRPKKKTDPFTKIETVDHYKVNCVWEVFVANAYRKRLAIETDWNAISLTFYDNEGNLLIFSWNMATAKSTVFPSATTETLVFPKRVRGYIGRAETMGVATRKFQDKEIAKASAMDVCSFNGINDATYGTINDYGFLIEGEGKKDYGQDTVLTVFLK